MLKKIAIATSIFWATSLFSSTASAEDGFYVGGNFQTFEYMESGIPNLDLKAISGRVGKKFNKYFSAEFRLGTGIGDDTLDSVTLEMDSFAGAYLRAGYPITPTIFPYGVIGYTNISLSASAPGISASDSGADSSFGAGVDIKVSDKWSINAEYINYYAHDFIEIDSLSIGVVANF